MFYVLLRPQDLVIALKIAAHPSEAFTGSRLAKELGVSLGEVHAGLRRAQAAQLVLQWPGHLVRPPRGRPSPRWIVNHPALHEFVIHGVKYVYLAERGKLARGVPTARSAAPLSSVLDDRGTPLVWPHPSGKVRGESFSPLIPAAVTAALHDTNLYVYLALVDSIRGGDARERELAVDLFTRFVPDAAPHA